MNETLEMLVPVLGRALLNFLWQGALIGLLAAVALQLLRATHGPNCGMPSPVLHCWPVPRRLSPMLRGSLRRPDRKMPPPSWSRLSPYSRR